MASFFAVSQSGACNRSYNQRASTFRRETGMKQFGWLLVVLLAAVPAWSAKKVTVQELKATLESLQQAKKADADVATALKQLELSEQLTRPVMNSLVGFVPGPLSTEQIYVLEARSAELPPPASDLPATA